MVGRRQIMRFHVASIPAETTPDHGIHRAEELEKDEEDHCDGSDDNEADNRELPKGSPGSHRPLEPFQTVSFMSAIPQPSKGFCRARISQVSTPKE
mmetsp:Transcript_8858/g.26290  ORF Transcript_8858/g.26290 Transcript_8858/m.26290 type:complete len:96 (-) Transcript_8858:1209-1496(-)